MNCFRTFLGTYDTDKMEETMQKFREIEDMLIKKQDFLEQKANQQIHVIKKNVLDNKKVALEALMMKNRYSKQLVQVDGLLHTLEVNREELKSNKNAKVLGIMENVAEELKKANMDIDLEKVETMEIGMDEDELEKELEEFKKEVLEDTLNKLPPVPSDEVVKPNAEDDNKGQELENLTP